MTIRRSYGNVYRDLLLTPEALQEYTGFWSSPDDDFFKDYDAGCGSAVSKNPQGYHRTPPLWFLGIQTFGDRSDTSYTLYI